MAPAERSGALPSSSDGHSSKTPRHYPICRDGVYSLKEAAQALHLPEGRLRRAILLDDLPAIDVADDRHYLIQGRILQAYVQQLRPQEEPGFQLSSMAFWPVVVLMIASMLGLAGFILVAG